MATEDSQVIEDLKTETQALKRSAEEARVAAEAAQQAAEGIKADAAERVAKAEGQMEELRTQLQEQRKAHEELKAAHMSVNRNMGGARVDRNLSLGEQVTADEKVKATLESGYRNLPVVRCQRPIARRDLVSGLVNVDNPTQPGSVDIPTRPLTIRDLLTVAPAGERDTIPYVVEVADWLLYTRSTAEAASGQNLLAVKSVAGLQPGAVIKVAPGTANEETATLTNVERDEDSASGILTLGGNLVNTHALGVEVTADTFSPTPEAEYKPQGVFKEEERSAEVKTIATGITASNQVLADESRLQIKINTKIPRNLMLAEEDQILKGNGAGANMQGILTHADIQTHNWSNGVTGDTQADAVARGANKVYLSHYMPNGVVFHPTDLLNVRLKKDSEGRYIYSMSLSGEGGQARVMDLPVVVSTAIPQGTALVGAFDLGATLYDREMVNIRIFEAHKDYAERNLVYMRGEERLALAIERPQAFCKVVFDNAPV